VRSDVTAVWNKKVTAFWDVISCSFVDKYKVFKEMYYPQFLASGSWLLQDIGYNYLSFNYMMAHPKKILTSKKSSPKELSSSEAVKEYRGKERKSRIFH
jgi:hypothetical protein